MFALNVIPWAEIMLGMAPALFRPTFYLNPVQSMVMKVFLISDNYHLIDNLFFCLGCLITVPMCQIWRCTKKDHLWFVEGLSFPPMTQLCAHNKCLSLRLPLWLESTLWPRSKCYLVKVPVCSSCEATVVSEPSSGPRSTQACSSVPPCVLSPARHYLGFIKADNNTAKKYTHRLKQTFPVKGSNHHAWVNTLSHC